MPELDQQELLYTHPGQPFLLHLEGALLRKMGDPHGHLPNILMHGVPMGVDEYIPNVPDVWPPSRRHTEPALEPTPLLSAERNYNSCEEHIAELRTAIRGDAQDNLCIGPVREADAEAICGTTELYYGALGAKEEYSTLADGSRELAKVRSVHDCTVAGLTSHIHQHLEGRTTGPTVQDAMCVMRLSQERQRAPCGLLVFDGSKAHRRIKLRRQDWRYAVCKLAPGEVYVDTSGVYGIASAQWWYTAWCWPWLAAIPTYLVFCTWMIGSGC